MNFHVNICRLVLLNVICTFFLSTIESKSSFCLSCLTEPPSYARANLSWLSSYLQEKGIQLPTISTNCAETPTSAQPEFRDVVAKKCPSGACVKLKGHVEDESFVLRGCWEKMWNYERVDDFSGCTNVEFMTETETRICICYGDLCNNTESKHLVNRLLIFLSCTALLSYFFLSFNLTLVF